MFLENGITIVFNSFFILYLFFLFLIGSEKKHVKIIFWKKDIFMVNIITRSRFFIKFTKLKLKTFQQNLLDSSPCQFVQIFFNKKYLKNKRFY